MSFTGGIVVMIKITSSTKARSQQRRDVQLRQRFVRAARRIFSWHDENLFQRAVNSAAP